jgi:hypothetical protein
MITKTYKPLDSDSYQFEEYLTDTQTGKSTFTGKRFRRVESKISADSDEYRALVLALKASGREHIMLYSPVDFCPYMYELI